jgi:hypothetical protein
MGQSSAAIAVLGLMTVVSITSFEGGEKYDFVLEGRKATVTCPGAVACDSKFSVPLWLQFLSKGVTT